MGSRGLACAGLRDREAAAWAKFMVAFLTGIVYNIPACRQAGTVPGLAKFGIAPGLGPGDRGFKSRNPDQKSEGALAHSDFCVIGFVEGLEQGGGIAAKNSPVDCFSARGKVPQPGLPETLVFSRVSGGPLFGNFFSYYPLEGNGLSGQKNDLKLFLSSAPLTVRAFLNERFSYFLSSNTPLTKTTVLTKRI